MSQSATEKGCGKCQLIWDGKYKGKECWLGFGPVLGCDVLEWEMGGDPPKCPNCFSFTCHWICCSGLVWLCRIICLPLTPTLVSPDPWDNFAPWTPDAPILREKLLTNSLTTIHMVIRTAHQIPECCQATLSLAHPISCFSFVCTLMNNLHSAVQTPEDGIVSSGTFMMLWWVRRSLCCTSAPNAGVCCCASSSFGDGNKKMKLIMKPDIQSCSSHSLCCLQYFCGLWSFSSHWAHLSLQSHGTVTVLSPQYMLLFFYSRGKTRGKMGMKDNFNTLIPSKTNKQEVGRWHARIF